ncbi:MAG: hypothetical protein WCP08_00370 [Prolixibacteraceae bacterium]
MKKMKTFFGVAAIVMLSYSVNAQTGTPEKPEVLKKILAMTGNWEGTGTMKEGGNTTNFPYILNVKKTAAGTGILALEEADIPGMGKMIGTNIAGYNSEEGLIHWYTIDNMGTTHDHLGKLVDKNHFQMVYEIKTKDNKAFKELIDVIFDGTDKLNMNLVITVDGQEQVVETASLTRKVNAPKPAVK